MRSSGRSPPCSCSRTTAGPSRRRRVQHSPIRDLSERAKAFGMKAVKVDGQDVEAVYKATRQALDYARSGKGPMFMHLDTVRFTGHYIGDPQVYRPKDQAKKLRETRDPIELLRARIEIADDEFDELDSRGDGDRRSVRRVREERHRPGAGRRSEERLCLSSATARRCATRCRPRCARTTTSSSWARTSRRWAARWASRTECSRSSARSACATRRSRRWRLRAPRSAPRCRACAPSRRSCTRTS